MWWFYYHTRRFFRSIMPPIPGDVAKKWHRRMQFLYILSAWNFAGYMWYISRDKKIEKVSPEDKYKRMAKRFNMQEVTAYRYKSGSFEKYDIDMKNNAVK